MNILEKEIEDLIWEASQTTEGVGLLKERGLACAAPYHRQFNIPDVGIIDLFYGGYYVQWSNGRGSRSKRTVYVQIVELKRGAIDATNVSQLCRYMAAIRGFYTERFAGSSINLELDGVLIGRSVAGGDTRYLLAALEPANVQTYLYSLDLAGGLRFTKWRTGGISDATYNALSNDVERTISNHAHRKVYSGLQQQEEAQP